jgi:N-acetylglucosamine-6-phosphate deacetylase
MTAAALCPELVLTPDGAMADLAVVVEGGRIRAVQARAELAAGIAQRELLGTLAPGFIDLQVNGGGGVLFNDAPNVAGIEAIGRAHRRFGTTGFLPTLISDDLSVVERGLRAVEAAIERGVPGVLGIHVEGPFLNASKKGIHDAAKMRLLDAAAVELLCSLERGATLVTLAPELAPAGVIRELTSRGVVVAAGHTAATYEDVARAHAEGLRGFTHIFNAMSPLAARAPGVVGAALDLADTWCGAICDGHHVHDAALRIAYRAKGADGFVLVTDAMPTVGSVASEFLLGGRRILANDGRLTGEDGTLAGSNLDMASAVRNAMRALGIDLAAAVRLASGNPARAVQVHDRTGAIAAGLQADFVLLDAANQVRSTWIAGQEVASA